MNVAGDDFDVPLDHATSFALVLHEVLSNALRHGFPDNREGTIDVQPSADDVWRSVTISDNGIGLGSERRGGIGETVIRTLAIQLDAETDRSSDANGCTLFSLRFAEQAVVDRLS